MNTAPDTQSAQVTQLPGQAPTAQPAGVELGLADGVPAAVTPDTDELGTPGAAAPAGALSPESTDTDELGIPGEEELDDPSTLGKRFKDTQAALTEKSQELAALREEQAESMAEITRRSYELQDAYAEQEEVAQFWASQAMQDLQRFQGVNIQQLTQEQYAGYQRDFAQARQKAEYHQQALNATKARAKAVRERAIQRAAAVSRASLVRAIPNFDEAYTEIGRYAIQNGVSPDVFREITDPGLIRLIHRGMQADSQKDTIKVTQQRQAQRVAAAANIAPPSKPSGPRPIADRMYNPGARK